MIRHCILVQMLNNYKWQISSFINTKTLGIKFEINEINNEF